MVVISGKKPGITRLSSNIEPLAMLSFRFLFLP
jgi:hypothetical protein